MGYAKFGGAARCRFRPPRKNPRVVATTPCKCEGITLISFNESQINWRVNKWRAWGQDVSNLHSTPQGVNSISPTAALHDTRLRRDSALPAVSALQKPSRHSLQLRGCSARRRLAGIRTGRRGVAAGDSSLRLRPSLSAHGRRCRRLHAGPTGWRHQPATFRRPGRKRPALLEDGWQERL